MNYKLNINIEPYSNVIIEMDSHQSITDDEIKMALRDGLLAIEFKKQLIAYRERELLVNEIEQLMAEKEFDSLGLCEYLEVINLKRDTLLKSDTQKLRATLEGLKTKPGKKG